GARAYLGAEPASGSGAVLAPPESRACVEALLQRLDGDLSFSTLAELRTVLGGVSAVVQWLRAEMEAAVLATHPADEGAVAAYFEFAHALSVEGRLRDMASEMEALIELVTGEAPTPEHARTFRFPD
ncbi:MAG TPA: hypothetical protein VFQ22_06020, partial [Longimicrobiales bacterium]|nr:hypothetical protein [Longimicrobiales bacterium]